jgi:tRNA-dihydrouridine synthase 2
MLNKIDYSNKIILAPMVRVNSLPFRLLALEYGANIVYSEELIALKLRKTQRIKHNIKKTIDFVDENGNIIYSTCKKDHPNVLQIGASDSIVALEAAEIISRDVDAIDLNMGCPKHFSISGGMGAALLKKPEIVKDILSTLKRNLNNPITCKIRLLDNISSTIELLKIIEQTGVSAIAIHTRYVHERPRDAAHWNFMTTILQSGINVPLIFNGFSFLIKKLFIIL